VPPSAFSRLKSSNGRLFLSLYWAGFPGGLGLAPRAGAPQFNKLDFRLGMFEQVFGVNSHVGLNVQVGRKRYREPGLTKSAVSLRRFIWW
jgi:hypothetical protein